MSVTTGASRVAIQGGATAFVEGTYTSTGTVLNISSSREDEHVQAVTMERAENPWTWMVGGRTVMDFRIPSDIPLMLNFDGGASSFDLDLRDVQVSSLDIDTGASTIDLALGDLVAENSVTIDAGASTISLSLPESTGVRIRLDAGLTSKTLPRLSEVEDNVFETDNYDDAEKQIDLRLALGASTLRVEWR
jgi:hypothetical protein